MLEALVVVIVARQVILWFSTTIELGSTQLIMISFFGSIIVIICVTLIILILSIYVTKTRAGKEIKNQ